MKLIIIFLMIISFNANSQIDCCTILSYECDTLFSGFCDGISKDKKESYSCYYDKGILKTCKHWNKKGILLDSSIYIDGFKKKKVFQFSKEGKINAIANYTLINKIDTNKIIDDNVVFFYENGNKMLEYFYYHDDKNRYLSKEYYENGNLKRSYIAYNKKLFFSFFNVIYDGEYIEFNKFGRGKHEVFYKDGKESFQNVN